MPLVLMINCHFQFANHTKSCSGITVQWKYLMKADPCIALVLVEGLTHMHHKDITSYSFSRHICIHYMPCRYCALCCWWVNKWYGVCHVPIHRDAQMSKKNSTNDIRYSCLKMRRKNKKNQKQLLNYTLSTCWFSSWCVEILFHWLLRPHPCLLHQSFPVNKHTATTEKWKWRPWKWRLCKISHNHDPQL